MKTKFLFSALASVFLASVNVLLAQGGDAILVRVEDGIQQIRVEANDAESGRWLAIASGYREAVDNGWLKIALPAGYEQADLRVLGSSTVSPFAGKMRNSLAAADPYVDYPDSIRTFGGPEANVDSTDKGGAEPVIEEADIWAWEDSMLYFYNQYRGLQVVDMADPDQPLWMDYFRYPAKGEDLYTMGDGKIILIGTGGYWNGEKLTLKFLQFDGSGLSETDSVELESGYYMDSRRYNDFLYVMTREWVSELDPEGNSSYAPLIRLYTVALGDGIADRVVDVQSYEGDGYMDAVLTAQPDGILLCLNKWYHVSTDWRYRWRSEVHVLEPGVDGIPVELGVAKLSGILHDKYKMNFNDGMLTTISQQADWSTRQFTRVTKVENFKLGDSGFERIGFVDIAPGETLFASRFYDDNIYIVTFEFVDPLFSIDNSNPTHPVVAGELEVPGWSNYIEWVGDWLFAVGIEEGKVTVSVFDVADPANMSMLDRVYLNEDSWAWSEAQYDDQAISIFPDAQMLMLPFTTYSWKTGGQIQAMQLITWDLSGMLELRGQVQHVDVPRRGVLMGTTVVTISGREVVTTDVTQPDAPVEGGSATLAWNVQHLIPHGDYWLQLESPDSLYQYWYWRSPYDPNAMTDPVLYVTNKDTPNIPEHEVVLDSGRLVGVAHQDGRLILLQDVTELPVENYWETPELQSLVVRVYDLTDPLSPVLLDEELLADVPYMGGSFEGKLLPDATVLWMSKYTPNNYIYMIDMAIWPGPWYYQTNLSYIVSTVTPGGLVDIPAYDTFPMDNFWNGSSGWFWEEPLLLASMTTYTEIERPETYPYYKAHSRLLAVDFTDPSGPVELPKAKLPGYLVAAESLPDGMNHFLYFEPEWNTLEVWGWDEAAAFPLFKQVLYPEKPSDTNEHSYSYAWMAPFHLRSRYHHNNGDSLNYLDVWYHAQAENEFKNIEVFPFDNRWLGTRAVQEPYYLQSTYDQLQVFQADAGSGAFTREAEIDLPFPNIYSLNLEGAVMADSIYVPVGIYGVEALPWMISITDPPFTSLFAQFESTGDDWSLLDASSWQRVDKAASDEAGIIDRMQWLYHADSLREIDPLAIDGGDLWRGSDWFGWYLHSASHPAWISHLEHGYLYCIIGPVSGDHGFTLYDPKLGYLWTRHGFYPHLYSHERARWLYYYSGTGLSGTRWFYDYGTGWFSVGK